MSYQPSLSEIAKLRSEYQARGIWVSDSEVKRILIKQNQGVPSSQTLEKTYPTEQSYNAKTSPVRSSTPYGGGVPGQPLYAEATAAEAGGPWWEHGVDFAAASLWQLFDTATFGLAGLGWQAIDEESYDWAQREMTDTAGGRVGQTLGGLAGFLIPYGAVGKATSMAGRALTTGIQSQKIAKATTIAKKLKVGKKILSDGLPTTSTIQKVAGMQLGQSLKKVAKQSGPIGAKGKTLETIAERTVKELTDDVIGFVNQGRGADKWWNKLRGSVFGRGPAYEMENSLAFVNNVKTTMRNTNPKKLQAYLKNRGVNISDDVATSLSDEMIDLVTNRPFASIENLMAGKYTGTKWNMLRRYVGSSTQEMVNLGIMGTTMDWVGSLRGEVDLEEYSLGERALYHAATGFAFGGAKFIPGGRARPLYKDFWQRTGIQTRRTKKAIKQMNPKELKAFAAAELRTRTGARFSTRADGSFGGVAVTEKMLRGGTKFANRKNTKEFKNLRDQVLSWQDKKFNTLKQKLPGEVLRDLWGSFPRMAVGGVLFNYESIRDGAFSHMSEYETAFHFLLGSVMSKRYFPLRPGVDPKNPTAGPRMGFHAGERMYVYNETLNQQIIGMEQAQISANHIKGLVKQYSGNTVLESLIEKNPNSDIDNIISILEAKDNPIISKMDASDIRLSDLPDGSDVIYALPNRKLMSLLAPISKILRYRGYDFNSKSTKKQQELALKEILALESNVLPTTDGNKQVLNSATKIRRSLLEGSRNEWNKIKVEITETFADLANVLGGVDNFYNADTGEMFKPIINKTDEAKLTPEQSATMVKFERLIENLIDHNELRIKDHSFQKAGGVTISDPAVKLDRMAKIIENFEKRLGDEFDQMGGLIEIESSDMWTQLDNVDYYENIVKFVDRFTGKEEFNDGWTDIDQTELDNIFSVVLGGNQNVQRGSRIINDPNNLEIKLEEGMVERMTPAEIDEFTKMEVFLKDVWKIATANGANPDVIPRGNEKIKVDYADVKKLHEKLIKAGMPDYIFRYSDTRMDAWINKAVEYGIENLTDGIDMKPYDRTVITRLMANGLIKIGAGTNSNVPRLEMPGAITPEQVIAKNPTISKERAEKIVKAYDNIRDNLSKVTTADQKHKVVNYVVDPLAEQVLTDLTADQFESIERINTIYDLEGFKDDASEMTDQFDAAIGKLDEEINNFTEMIEDLEGENRSKEASTIKEQLDLATEKRQILGDFFISYTNSFLAGTEIGRAAATIQNMKWVRSERDRSAVDIFNDILNVTDLEDYKLYKDELKKIQIQVAENVSKVIEVETHWDTKSEENITRMQHEEAESRLRDQHASFNIEDFILEHNIERQDLLNATGDPNYVFKNNQDLFQQIYFNIVGKGKPSKKKITKFVNKMFELAGTDARGTGILTKGNRASRKRMSVLRDQIQQMITNLTSSNRVKKLTITGDGSGKWTNSFISDGHLTELWRDIFGFGGNDMILLTSNYVDNVNGSLRIQNVFNSGYEKIQSSLDNGEFSAFNSKDVEQQIKNDIVEDVLPVKDVGEPELVGRHSVVRIDENIAIAVPRAEFHSIADSFVKFYENFKDQEHVKNLVRKDRNVKDLVGRLDKIYNNLVASKKSVLTGQRGRPIKKYSEENYIKAFDLDSQQHPSKHSAVHDFMHTVLNVMYSEKIDSNWLENSVGLKGNSLSDFKYRRLAHNLGYRRNSREIRDMAYNVYINGSNRQRRLVKKFNDIEHFNTVVIDDSEVSHTHKGKHLNYLITDGRSSAIKSLEIQYEAGLITEDQYRFNKKRIKESESLSAEEVNGMTAVNRDVLDYLLLIDGKSELIGESPGQKPVGLSSYTDAQGVRHVFYNKTHYFYDSRLDPFFAKDTNKNIHMISFKSGAKKSSSKDSAGEELFIPVGSKNSRHGRVPRLNKNNYKDSQSVADWINTLEFDKSGIDEGVMQVEINKTLAGTTYAKDHDARIMKQFDNWTSRGTAVDLYKWSRKDAAERFANIMVQFTDPTKTGAASAEAQGMLRGKAKPGEGIDSETPGLGVMAIYIDAGGVPFSSLAKTQYDAFLKKKYIDDAGVMDGFTSGGAIPILRGNLSGDLSIPMYQFLEGAGKDIQTHLGEFNVSSGILDRKIYFRENYLDTGTSTDNKIREDIKVQMADITLSMFYSDGMGNRDLLVNLKTKEVYDPLRPDESLSLSDKNFKKQQTAINWITREMQTSIETWRDLANLLRDPKNASISTKGVRPDLTNIYLTSMGMPAPRTGPHDSVVMKLSKKGLLEDADGPVIELNTYDVTLRAQRDYDTDKLPFYMDTPFSAMKESFQTNAAIKEALLGDIPVEESRPVDLYNRDSFSSHLNKINLYKKARGTTIKMHRKMTYALRLFDSLADKSLKITLNGQEVAIKFNKSDQAIQRLVNDSQGILDIYKTLITTVQNENGEVDMGDWQRRTLFGSSEKKTLTDSTPDDSPFFVIDEGDGKSSKLKEHHMLIVEKVLDDFGRVLQLESGVWEAGEAKTPRYKDMVRLYNEFRKSYTNRKEKANWEMYWHLRRKGQESIADDIFFDGDAEKKQNKLINNVMNDIALNVLKDGGPTPFLKSLEKIATKDYLKVKEVYTPAGDSFSQAVDQYLGELRAEALNRLQMEGELVDIAGLADEMGQGEKDGWFTEDLWNAFNEAKDYQTKLSQANSIETDIRRTEKLISKEKKQYKPDNSWIAMKAEDVRIKRALLDDMLNRLQVDEVKDGVGQFGQKMKSGKNTKIYRPNDKYSEIHVVNTKTGKLRYKIVHEDNRLANSSSRKIISNKFYELKKDETAIENPVILKAVTDHDALDGIATAQAVSGYWAHVQEADVKDFHTIVKETRLKINSAMSEIMKNTGYRDWDAYAIASRDAIDDGLKKIANLAHKESAVDMQGAELSEQILMMPDERHTYALDFMMALIGPDYSKNPNEYHFLPKSRQLVPAVDKPNSSVIKAVFKAMEDYNLYSDRVHFIQSFAQAHRGFYDALVGGQNFEAARKKLANSTFQGALLEHTLDKAMNRPFLNIREYTSIGDDMDMMPVLNSQYAEFFRQIIQDGAIYDPKTVFNVRRMFEDDPQLTSLAYKNIWRLSRGEIIFDGISASKGSPDADGIIIGDITMDRRDRVSRRITGSKPVSRKGIMRKHVGEQVGGDVESQTNKDGKSCQVI